MPLAKNVPFVVTLNTSAPSLQSPPPAQSLEGPPSFTLDHFASLPSTFPSPIIYPTLPTSSLSIPKDSLAFLDPSLLKSLSIFMDKTHVSPSTLPLDSIHFANVTI